MAVALVPYTWKTDDGMPHWALPDNVTSAIDLRPTAMHVHLTALGYAVAVVDGELPEGAIELGAGNATRDRDAWERALFFRPSGDTVEEMVWSHLTDGADDAGESACRPLRCHKPDRMELHLGGRKERQTTHTERLKQAVLIRADLARMVDDETIPRRMLGKFLQAEADRMGIDAITLRGKGAKLRDIRPERPETTITDPFRDNASFIFLSAYTPSGEAGAWTVAGENGNRFQTGNNGSDGLGSKLYFDGGGGSISIGNASNYGWHPTSLSSSNNVAVLESVTRTGGQPSFGPIIRGNGSTSGYTCDNASTTVLKAYSLVSDVGTLLGTATRSVQTRDDLRAGANGSSIFFNDQATGISLQVSNTALTVGLRVGVHGFSAGGQSEATGFAGRDFLTPTVTSIAPSSGSTAGGTAVTITGTGFESTSTVAIGGASATSVVVVSDTSITCVTPSVTAGAKDVVVTNPDGGFSGTLAGGFTYGAPSAGAIATLNVSRRRR